MDGQEISFQINISDIGDDYLNFDFCSPLCPCHCYSYMVTNQNKHQLSTNSNFNKVVKSNDLYYNYSCTFWNPPKQV